MNRSVLQWILSRLFKLRFRLAGLETVSLNVQVAEMSEEVCCEWCKSKQTERVTWRPLDRSWPILNEVRVKCQTRNNRGGGEENEAIRTKTFDDLDPCRVYLPSLSYKHTQSFTSSSARTKSRHMSSLDFSTMLVETTILAVIGESFS